MTLRNDILSELLTLSPFLATVERGNPFRVPHGYFSQLAQTTLETALEYDELQASAPVTMNLRMASNNMSVPEGYFETLFHNTMAQLTEDAEEKVNLPDAATPFTTPAGYFEQLQANILLAVKEAAADEDLNTQFLQDATATEGFTTPPQYFEELQANIMNRINNLGNEEAGFDTANIDQLNNLPAFTIPSNYFEELQEGVRAAVSEEEYLPQLLAQLPKSGAFTTPDGFFDHLHQQVMNTIGAEEANTAQTGKTVPMVPAQRRSNSGFRYVLRVAAVLAVLFVGWQLLNQPSQGNGKQTALLNPPSPQLLIKMEKMKSDLGLTSSDLSAYINNNAEEFAKIDLEDMKIDAGDIAQQPQTNKRIELNPEAMDLLDISSDDVEEFFSE